MNDVIYRQAAIDAVAEGLKHTFVENQDIAEKLIGKLPSAQSEQSNALEFWRKRADYYSDLCMRLIAEMGKGVKIESVKISENGIEFIKEQPSVQPDLSSYSDKLWRAAYERGKKEAQDEIFWGYTPTPERPLADVEIVSRLKSIQKQIGGSYAIDRAIEIIEAVAERRTDGVDS